MSRSQDERFMRATAGVGIAAASLIGSIAWLASGAISAMVSISSYSSIGRVLSVAFPPILPVTSYPTMWGIVIHVLAGILFAGIAVLLLRLLLPGAALTSDARRRRVSIFVTIWLVMILASYLSSAVCDLALLVSRWVPGYSALMEVGVAFARPTPWGVIWGWLPALVGTMTLMWITSEQNTTSQDAQTEDHDTPQATPGRKTTLMIVGLVVAAAAAVVIASPLAEKAYRAANLARPMPVPSADPTVIGSPTISYAVDPNVAPDWCSQDVLLEPGFQDAATGHRSRTITITNTGAASCVLEGYPDVAFNDGGGNAMDVLMVRGGSFLTDDPGPTRIVLHPGASAEAYLGWSAVAGQSEVSAGTVLLAPYAGAQRQPTPMPLDINNGQPVAMTAWGQVRTADGD